MMADYAIPKNGVAYIFYGCLVSQADTKLFKSAPTLAAGDFKVSTDGGAFANLATLPTNTPGTFSVKFSLSASEMTGDNILVVASDAAGAEWCDQAWNIQTSARGVADLAFPTTSGRSLDVTATGAAGIDWGNVENATTAVNLSATNIDVDQVVASVTADVTLSAAEENAIADAILGRNVAGGSSAGRLVKEALYVLRNKTAISAGTLTVYGTDDATPSFTAAVTTAAGNPIDSIDPA